MRKPYIGICDFTAPEQTQALLKYIPMDFSHQLMVGVMMSRKTLLGLPTKWADVFPKKETIKDIFVADPRVLNTIHYADYEPEIAGDELAELLFQVLEFGGEHLGAIQLDMIWPSPYELNLFQRYHGSDLRIVLQVGEHAMAQCGNDPIAVCERLRTYGNSIDYVLFDKSMGKGKGMDAELLSHYVGALVSDCPHLLPAVAGGLGPMSMHLVEPLMRAYPEISIDMQSKLRKSGNATDPIDWWMAEEAVRQAVVMKRRFLR